MSSYPTATKEYRLPKRDSIKCLTLQDGQVPALKASEVLVKVEAVSLNFRDVIIAKGTYPMPVTENVIPGSDMSSTIIAVGSEVSTFKPGDKVCANFTLDHLFGEVNRSILNSTLGGACDGVLTQYRAVPARSLVKIPKGWTHEQASTLPCAALTAYNALHGPIPVKAGDYVLVQGTGGVSIFGLQFALASGATVIATSSSDDKLKLVQKLGAKHLINYNTTPDWDKEVLKITNGRGVDHIIEVGGPGTIVKSFSCIKYGGWIHTIGFVAQGDKVPNLAPLALSKAAMLRGILIGSVAQFEDMNRLIEANDLLPVVDKVFPFNEAVQAYEYLESQKHVGKVVIKVSE